MFAGVVPQRFNKAVPQGRSGELGWCSTAGTDARKVLKVEPEHKHRAGFLLPGQSEPSHSARPTLPGILL